MTGVDDLEIKDEWYYQLKFATEGEVRPLLKAKLDEQAETVAWAYTRTDDGRSFGYSGVRLGFFCLSQEACFPGRRGCFFFGFSDPSEEATYRF